MPAAPPPTSAIRVLPDPALPVTMRLEPGRRCRGEQSRVPLSGTPWRRAGLDRAAAILAAFDVGHRELTLAGLVERSGLPRSTAHRTADKMIRLGWLDKPRDRYRVGNRLFEVSSLAPIRHELRESVLPFLQDLHHAAKTTVQLGVLDGPQVLVVERITGHRPMPMLARPAAPSRPTARPWAGPSSPTPTRAVDEVLAAGLPARTPRTLTSAGGRVRELPVWPTGAGRPSARRATSASAASPRRCSGRWGRWSRRCR